MEARELRLNNIISYCGVPVRVSNLGNNGFETIRGNGLLYGDSDVEKYKAIPLTEEILLKSGFKEHLTGLNRSVFTKDYINLEFCIGGMMCYYGTMILKIVIKSVHQLQNLYFALTGKELEIKL